MNAKGMHRSINVKEAPGVAEIGRNRVFKNVPQSGDILILKFLKGGTFCRKHSSDFKEQCSFN